MNEDTQRQIILMVVAVVLICSAVLSAMSYRKASQILSGQLEATYSVAADRYAQELSAWIRTYATYIDALAADIVTSGVTEYDNEAFHKYLESNFNLLNDDGVMYDIYFTNPNNIMVCASDYISDGSVDYAHDREWFVEAVSSGKLYYSAPYMDADSGLPVLTISKAVYVDGDLRGVLCADIFVDTLVGIISNADVAENSYAFLVDQNMGMCGAGGCTGVGSDQWHDRCAPDAFGGDQRECRPDGAVYA